MSSALKQVDFESIRLAPSGFLHTGHLLLKPVRWLHEQVTGCRLDPPPRETARLYLGDRRLTGETVRRFGLGYAPAAGDWLVQRAGPAGVGLQVLEKVGLAALRQDGDR